MGRTQAEASSRLHAAGYTLGAVHFAIDDSCGFIGLVMDQSPAAGTQASPGTAVSITIGRKPKFCSP
jgi:beta-lactam-binding protein with PASTA domain